jgi:hypothetical protein
MKPVINAGLKAKLPSKGHLGVIRRGEHDDVSHHPALLDEPADNLVLRWSGDLGVVGADEQRSLSLLLQALGKRPTAERRNHRIISIPKIVEA